MSQVKPDSKYYPLYQHLRAQASSRVELSMGAIEALLGTRLPAHARRGRAFWSNRSAGSPQATAWTAAGYRVANVDQQNERLVFERPMPRAPARWVEGEVIWDGRLVRALRTHLGLNQAGLAALLGVRQQTVSEWETGAYEPTRARSRHLTMVAERAEFPFDPGPPQDYPSSET